MQATLRQDGLVHRMSMSGRGRAYCGATPPDQGWVNLAVNGVGVTCPSCQPQQPPSIRAITCPRCFDHGWRVLTEAEAQSSTATCGRCDYTAPAREFLS
jgi:hypothetical protein